MPQEPADREVARQQRRAAQAAFIRSERGRQGMSQQQLATLAGISRSLVSQIESGTRTLTDDVIACIADALDVKEVRLRNPQSELWRAA